MILFSSLPSCFCRYSPCFACVMLQRINSRALPNGFWDIKDWNDFVWIFMNQGRESSPQCTVLCPVLMACTLGTVCPVSRRFDDESGVGSCHIILSV